PAMARVSIPAARVAARPASSGALALKRVLGPDHRLGYLFVTPIVLFVLSLVGYPFCYAIYLSMTHKLVGLPPVFVGFENYVRLTWTGSSSARSSTRSSSRSARWASSSCWAW